MPCQLHSQHVPRIEVGEVALTWQMPVWPAVPLSKLPDNVSRVEVCPIGYARVNAAVAILIREEGNPSWDHWQHYGRKERALAFRIYSKWRDAGFPDIPGVTEATG